MSSTHSVTTVGRHILRHGRIQSRRTARQVFATAVFPTHSSRIIFSSFAAANSGGRLQAVKIRNNRTFLEWYSEKLDAYPLLTKAITGGIIAAMGDILCQTVVPSEADKDQQQSAASGHSKDGKSMQKKLSSWDPWRTIRFATVGAFYMAPATHFWYGALTHRLLPGPSTPLRIAQRVAADQFGFAPFFASTFIGILWLLEGRWQDDAHATMHNLADTMPGVVLTGWKLWVPAMVVNFGFVPFKYQVLYSNFLSLFWKSYLSYISSSSSNSNIERE